MKLIVLDVAMMGCGSAGLAQRTHPRPKPTMASPPQKALPEMVFPWGEGPISSLAFAPDGKTLAVAAQGHVVKVYDVATNELARVIGEEGPIRALAYSPDGKHLATGVGRREELPDGMYLTTAAVRLWNPATGQPEGAALTFPDKPAQRSVVALAFSPDGKLLAAGTETLRPDDRTPVSFSAPYGEVTVWDMTTRKVRFHVSAHGQQTTTLAFSPDGSLLASGGRDANIKLWNPSTGKLTRTLISPKQTSAECLAFLPDGRRLAAVGRYNGSGCIWNVETGTVVQQRFGLGFDRFILMEGGKTAIISGNSQLTMIDIDSNRVLTQFGFASYGALAVTADSKTVATGSNDGTIQFWNFDALDRRAHIQGSITGMGDRIATEVAVSPDGGLLAVSSEHGVPLWETRHARMAHLLVGTHNTSFNDAAFSPNGAQVIAGTNGYGVLMWDTQSGVLLHSFPMDDPLPSKAPIGSQASRVAFSPDGKRFAASGQNKTYRIWNAQTLEREQTLNAPGVPSYSLAFAPDSRVLATGDLLRHEENHDNAIRFWDLSTGQTSSVFNDPRDKDRADRFVPPRIAYVPGRSLLASWAYSDTAVMLWSLPAGTVAKQLETGPEGLTGLAVSPDGGKLAVAGMQGMVSLWEVASGRRLRQWQGHDASTHGLAFSPDGKTLYTTSVDHTLKFWNVADGKLRGTLRLFFVPESRDNPLLCAWIFTTPQGYYTASRGAEELFRSNMNGRISPAAQFQKTYNRPDLVEKLLNP